MESLPSDPTPVADDLPSREELTAFVGKNADYYIGEWARQSRSRVPRPRFNTGAFLLSALWLGYRKMYRVAAAFVGIVCIETVIEEIVFVGFMGLPEVPILVSRLAGVAFAVVAGFFGNRWYLAHATREIARARASGLTGDELEAALAERGGRSVLASIATFAASLLLFAVVIVGLELAVHSSSDVGTQLQFYSNDDVYILAGVEDTDAGALAEFLEQEGIFGGEGASVQLARGPQGYIVSIVLPESTWIERELITYYEELGARLANERFGRPLAIELCDENFESRRTLVIE